MTLKKKKAVNINRSQGDPSWKLADKDFKANIISMFKLLKENMATMNEQIKTIFKRIKWKFNNLNVQYLIRKIYGALHTKDWGRQEKYRSTWIQIHRNYPIWKTEGKIIFEKWTEPQIYETISSDNLHVIGEPRKEEQM